MNKSISIATLTCGMWLLNATGSAADAPATAPSVSGTATYLERMALPPGAVFEARIEDVSRADAASTVIAGTRVDSPRVPVHFSIPYDPARIDAHQRYVVRATITADGHLMFTTDTAYPVLGADGNHQVDMILRRAGASAAASIPSEPSRRLHGMYTYMADAGFFTDCLSGRRLPVAQEADNAALERAYGKARSSPGAPVSVSVDGRIVMRPPVEGTGQRPTLIVDRFRGVLAQGCGKQGATVPLEGTHWSLITLGGKPIEVAHAGNAPYIALQPEQKRVEGSGGCNHLVGSYLLDGERLAFAHTASTMMACLDGMEQEHAFLSTLSSVARWHIDGQRLDLKDEHGAVLAQFKSQSS